MARITAAIQFEQDVTGARLAASTSPTMSSPIYSDPVNTVGGIGRFVVEELTGGTTYYLQAETEAGLRDDITGIAKAPTDGAHSFKFWCGGDVTNASNHAIFDAIRETLVPDFGIHLGDFNYTNETSTVVADHLENWMLPFSATRQAQLYREVPMMVIWDDHDYGPDNSDGTAPGRDAACEAFRSWFPSPDLFIEAGATDAIYYKFSRGRVVFLVTDLRSMSDPATDTDDADKTMMGAAQKAWFLNELANNPGKLIVWVSSSPWTISRWDSFATERTEIADAIKAVSGLVDRMCIIHADRHILAIDDGTNSDFATGGGAGIPVFCAAPLSRSVTVDQGSWSHGIFNDNENQVGLVDVTDSGGETIGVTFTGYEYDEAEVGNLGELVTYSWSATVGAV